MSWLKRQTNLGTCNSEFLSSAVLGEGISEVFHVLGGGGGGETKRPLSHELSAWHRILWESVLTGLCTHLARERLQPELLGFQPGRGAAVGSTCRRIPAGLCPRRCGPVWVCGGSPARVC